MLDFLAQRAARHRALKRRPCNVAGCAVGDGGGRGLGRPARRRCCSAACASAGRGCAPSASAGRGWRSRASKPGGRTTSWPCTATSRCCGTIARSPASATRWPSACCSSGPMAFIGVDAPDFNLGLEARLRRSGVQARSTSSVRRSGPGAAGASRSIARGVDHVLCLFPFEPELLRQARRRRHLRRPSAGRRDSARRCRAPRPALRSGLARARPVVALLPGSRRSRDPATSRRAFLQAAALLHRRRPDLRFVLPVVPRAARRRSSRCVAHARARTCRSSCSTAARTRRWRPATSTLIASGTATLEAALFKRPMVIGYRMHCAQLADDEAHAATSPGSACPTSCCSEFVVPELLQDDATPDALADAVLAWLDDAGACRARWPRASTELHLQLRRDTARAVPPMRSRRFLKPEQLGLGWRRPGAGGRRRRGRPRPAGRAGGGRRGDPRRAAADQGLADSKTLVAAAARAAVRRDPRQGAVLLRRRGQRRGDRPRSTSCRPRCWRCAAPSRACACGRTACWSTATGCRCWRMPARGHRQGRCQGAGHLGRVDPGQGAPRPAVPGAARALSAVRLRRATRATRRPSTCWRCARTAPAPQHRRSFAPVRAVLPTAP